VSGLKTEEEKMEIRRPSDNARAWWIARRRGIRMGTDCADDVALYLKLSRFETHLHCIGPPGCGKSRLLFGLFQNLCGVPGATVILVNPKGRLARMCRDWMIERRLVSRLVWFDPGDPQATAGYNPLTPNTLPIASHAKAVRESIRSAWGQAAFDQTPQLARCLFLALALARSQGWGLVEALNILRPDSRIRRSLLDSVIDPVLRESLAYFHNLKATRQEELAASSLARLEAFVGDETIRRVITHTPALDLSEVIRAGRVLIVNLEIGRPLRIDDVRMLGRFFVNDILNHVFERPEGERGPVFLICDEAQLFATTDLCSALDMGRELGLHCILAHQHLGQLRDEERTGYLYHSVMTCARTKAIFGGLSVEDLEVLTKETMIDQFDPMAVKDEITSLELDPIETSRLVFSYSVATGRTSGETQTKTKGRSHGTFETSGTSVGFGTARSSGHSSGMFAGASAAEVVLASGDVTIGTTESCGETSGDFSSESTMDTESSSQASGVQESASESESRGTNSGMNTGMNTGVAIVPFYEYNKRRVVSSRTFVSQEEFLTARLQEIKAQPQAHFVLKTDGHPAIFCKAPFVGDPRISNRRRGEALARIFSEAFYLPAPPPVRAAIAAVSYQPEDRMVEFSEPPPLNFLDET
jgi:hypothetical protein